MKFTGVVMHYLVKLQKTSGEIKNHPLRYVIIFLIVFCPLVFFFQSSDSLYPRHGDVFTDAAAIISAKNFIERGVVNLKYALMFNNPPANDNFDSSLLYLHHPTLPVLILTLFYYLGFSTNQARVFPLLMSTTGLLASYLLGKKVFDESWGWGVMLAIAVAAPFKLLSDQFFIVPYVFVVRAWVFYVVVSVSLGPINERRKWLVALSVLGFAAMNVAGWESLLPMGIFTILFPLIMIKGDFLYKFKLIRDLSISLGIGLLLGGLTVAAQHIWVYGGFVQALQDVKQSFLLRASASPLNIINYIMYVFFRLLRFYPLHMLVIFPFLPILLRALKLKIGYKLDNKFIKFILILLVSESAWYVLLRQHTFEHDHTINLLLLTIGFGTALGVNVFYTMVKSRNLPIWFFRIPLTAMWLASFFNVGIISYDGNIQVDSDILKYSQQQVDFLTSRLNRNDVLVLDTTRYYYLYQSYALYQTGQLFVEPQHEDVVAQNKKLFIAEPFREKYDEYIGKYYLKALVPPIAVFDPSLPPGELNQIFEKSGDSFVKVDDRNPSLFAFTIKSPGANSPQELSFSLSPGEPGVLSFMLAQPLEILEKGLSDGVEVNFILIENELEQSLLLVSLSPANKAWVPVDIILPNRLQDATLKVSVTCGGKNDCVDDEVYVAPVFDE